MLLPFLTCNPSSPISLSLLLQDGGCLEGELTAQIFVDVRRLEASRDDEPVKSFVEVWCLAAKQPGCMVSSLSCLGPFASLSCPLTSPVVR